ncbi:hypothetical protein SISSUDRAFT_871490 [Sistotremastrum suecicum HHB10207 ss-3]|uniref:Plastocyanin-like domain-containing protein n=1 Tax=Sistotremastrum suecicum HHB10207 ss-3 TaxID=1314776 RepID=A0A166CCP9_9AGAM|nr:hypothetical protein SISSUDRAFT_871490 [Sistotremastrum suecicum HHB10207 ss-3]
MPGGFHSGFAGINIGGTLDNPMEWNLTITDDSAPIWYHCSAIIPVPHCQGGMVGAINAGPSSALNAHNQSFDNFMVAAKAAPVLPAEATPLATAVLTGVGAMATATPMVRAGSVVSSSHSQPYFTTCIIARTYYPENLYRHYYRRGCRRCGCSRCHILPARSTSTLETPSQTSIRGTDVC